ncbi:MAG: radical SAM protein, partial [Nanoarchaeota archaeon]|nr:radical SAM protein [Nanoarchaeota archaeon]
MEIIKDFGMWLSRKINYPLVSPDNIQISLTYRCNLNCSMCEIHKHGTKKFEPTKKDLMNIIKQAKDFGIKEILFTGGEPFLRKDIFDIIKNCSDNNIRTIVTTNGTLISNNDIKKIFESKLSHVHISIDGLNKTHDLIRGKNSFKKATNLIAKIQKLRIKNDFSPSIGIACTIMNENVHELFSLTKFAERMGVDVINFQPLANNNMNFNDKSISKFWVKDENLKILDQEIEKIDLYRGKINIYKNPDLNLIKKYYRQKNQTGHLKSWKCFAGFKTIFIPIINNQKKISFFICDKPIGTIDDELKNSWYSKKAKKAR